MPNLQTEPGNGLNFQSVSTGMELPDVAFEPISIAVMNQIVQAWFRFLKFTLFFDSLSFVSIVENRCAST